MRKLSLEMLRLTSDEVLQRSQMKKITGGYGGMFNCNLLDCHINWGCYQAGCYCHTDQVGGTTGVCVNSPG